MPHIDDIPIRDPFILPAPAEGLYYLYGTTAMPQDGPRGFAVYTGRDLTHWDGPFPAYEAADRFAGFHNFWAPEVHPWRGRYVMLASVGTDTERHTYAFVADTPAGPFHLHGDGPLTPAAWMSIDGTLYVDESGQPWLVFVHEWTQISNGRMMAAPLREDLGATEGEPVWLFNAADPAWAGGQPEPGRNYVTDAPFLHHTPDGRLAMLWSSFTRDERYLVAVARSTTGQVTGPWVHDPEPLTADDHGHPMLFRTFEGQLTMAIHTQKAGWGKERMQFFPISEWLTLEPGRAGG